MTAEQGGHRIAYDFDPEKGTTTRRKVADDPREAVLDAWERDIRMEALDGPAIPDIPSTVLRKLDAADPLRAMLGEVVADMEEAHQAMLFRADELYQAHTRHLQDAAELMVTIARLRTLTQGGGS